MLKLLIADDHPLVLAGVRRSLEADGEFEIVGEANSGSQVLPLVERTAPDAILLDMRMPGLDGLTALSRIHARHPKVKVVMCSMNSDPEVIETAFKRGASGYIIKSIDARDLGAAIRQAVNGSAYHALGLPGITTETIGKQAGLTERETDIIKMVARGMPNKLIARELWVTQQTVKFHLTNIYRKLGFANRTEAASWALSKGLLDDNDREPQSTH